MTTEFQMTCDGGVVCKELLECPVCECVPEVCGSEKAQVFWVICDFCGSKTRWRPTKEDAIKEWNDTVRRHSNTDMSGASDASAPRTG